MAFSLIPRSEHFFDDFVGLSTEIQGGARVLKQMMSSDAPDMSKADAINLGLPIANTEFHICSPRCGLQPVGVPGELLIGGDGLARGYFRLEEMTREKFVPHPSQVAPSGNGCPGRTLTSRSVASARARRGARAASVLM